MRRTLVVTALFAALVAAASCATGTVEGDYYGGSGEGAGGQGAGSPDGGGGGATTSTTTTSDTTTSTTNTTSSTSTTSTTTSTSTSTCNPPQHLCGGVCVGNTPDTGCYQSANCFPCPTPAHGSSTCAAGGQCDVVCAAPYVKSGTNCVCPSQCCSDQECGGSNVCDNGSCVTPCDQALCIFACGLQGKVGICAGNTCVCIG